MTGFIIILCAVGATAYTEMAGNVINNLEVADRYPEALKTLLRSLNSVEFTRLSATDFIYKNYFSFFAIFMVLIAVDIFAIDKERGTMKFAMLSGVKPAEIYAGKLFAATAVTVGITLMNFIFAFVAGLISVGGKIIPVEFFGVFGIYLSASVPGMAVVTIISALSLLPINSKVILGGGIMLVFILGMADSLTAVGKAFSPIGLLSIFGNNIPFISAGFISSLLISFIYTALFAAVLIIAARKIDYFD
jgi:ABC-type transport system involved in multi-copper enzyme maturation permease subunit